MSGVERVEARLLPGGAVEWRARGASGRAEPAGGAATPTEHLLAALAASMASTAARLAQRRGVPLDDVRASAEVETDERGEPVEVRLRIHVVSAADEGSVASVFEQAERACAVTKLLGFEPDWILVHERP